jgi:prepilin-type N-terminal cleavage/methylation domain-containing protein
VKSNSLINKKGFTLLEVVIALTILAVLTIAATTSLQQGLKAKVKIQDQIEDMSMVRDSLRIIERDINLTYHYTDIEMEFLAEVACRSRTQPIGTPPPNGGFPSPQPPPIPGQNPQQNLPACLEAFPHDPKVIAKYQFRHDPETQFFGHAETLDFVTMNVSRLGETEVMADFAKVGYSLKPCKKPDGSSAGQCLVRRFSSIVEGDVSKGGEDTVMVEHVTEFKLRYFGKGKQDWNSDWSSGKGGDGATKGNFPQAVEITLTIEVPRGLDGKAKKRVSMQIVAGIRNPNNKEATTANAGGANGLPGSN